MLHRNGHRAQYLNGGDTLVRSQQSGDAILIIGQSNASGYDSATALSVGNAGFAAAFSDVQIIAQESVQQDPLTWWYYSSGNTGPNTASPPSAFGSVAPHFFPGIHADCVGPEISLARDLHTGFPGTYSIIKFTLDGSSVTSWLSGSTYPTSPPGGPNLWTQLQTFITNTGRTVRGIYWHQGEGDANGAVAAANYATNLSSFLDQLLAAFGNVPIVVGKISDDITTPGYTHVAEVRASQVIATRTSPMTTLVDLDDLALKADGLHLSADSQITAGQRAYSAWNACRLLTTLSSSLTDNTGGSIVANGTAYAYTVAVTNTGSNAAANMNVVVTLPSGIGYVSASGTGWTISQASGVVWCTRSAGAVGALPSITINCTSPTAVGSGSMTATATVQAGNVATVDEIDDTTTLTNPAVTRDGTSNVWLPQDATEWSNFITAQGISGVAVPDALWLMQETSGNLADAIGLFPLTLSGTNAFYQQAVTGWSTKGISWINAATASFQSTSTSLPDLSTTSITMLLFVRPSAGTSNRGIMGAGTSNFMQAQITVTPRLVAASGANTAVGTVSPAGAVRPLVQTHNRTALTHRQVTDQEKLNPTFSASSTGKRIAIGGSLGIASSPPMTIVYACMWKGTNAEMSDATLKALLQAFGFTIPWS
jgi:uncharacterized repeat protein (TIGR01451 family)